MEQNIQIGWKTQERCVFPLITGHYLYLIFGSRIGVFGVPLEILLEREGADSMLGVSRATLRIPSFIEDVVSAMRQMGTCHQFRFHASRGLIGCRYVRRRDFPKEWQYSRAQ